MNKLVESIKRHEGFRDRIYLDSLGKPTCGYGHHLWVGSRVPIEASEAFFKQDLADAISDYARILPSLRKRLNPVRARIVVEMIFNMNLAKVQQFRRMWEAIQDGDYEEASRQMMDSMWAQQVGYRAEELSEIMKNGVD